MANRKEDDLRCSFCNKRRMDVNKVIAGPSVLICDECVDICNDILAEDKVPGALTALEAELSGRSSSNDLVRCRLCQVLYTKEESTAFPDRGWLCHGCVDSVRKHLEESERPAT
jgi:hypothetical protein